MNEDDVIISGQHLRELLHFDANRCGMEHKPYRRLVETIRSIVEEQIGTEGVTQERKE